MLWYLLTLIGMNPQPAPHAFIQQVYAGYQSHDYSPLNRLDDVFAPGLATAIREDSRLANGEVGFLDGDPLCDCQDYRKLTATVRSMKLAGQRKATAAVDIDLGIDAVRHLRLELVRTSRGWRIADVVSRRTSLLRDLQRSNREAIRRSPSAR